MRLTTKGRFAVTAMIDLGLRQGNGPVTLAAISQRQQISLSYLEQLLWQIAPTPVGRVDPRTRRRLHTGAPTGGYHGGRNHHLGGRAN